MAKGSQSGVVEGTTQGAGPRQNGERPIDEEDVFGGAERTHDQRQANVKSEHVKP